MLSGCAIASGHEEVALHLLAACPPDDLNALEGGRAPFLYSAAIHGRYKVAQELLRLGADPNTR